MSTVDLLLLLEWMVQIGCHLGNSFGPIRFNAWRISPIENGPCLDNSATHRHVFINSGPNLCVSVLFCMPFRIGLYTYIMGYFQSLCCVGYLAKPDKILENDVSNSTIYFLK